MTARREFSASVKRAAFARSEGVCEVHRMKPGIADFPASCDRVAKELDHIDPDCLGGEPTLENSAYLCRAHHKVKTKADQAARKKRNAHTVREDRPQSYSARKSGGKKQTIPARGFQSNRDSRFKKKLDGSVVERGRS